MFEDLFASAELDVVVPESDLEISSLETGKYPEDWDADDWLARLQNLDRKQAFFDEHLQSLFTVRIPNVSENEPTNNFEPPRAVLSFLAHLQVSLEVSYISPVPAAPEAVSPNPNSLAVTPRSASTRFNVPTPPLPEGRASAPPRSVSLKKPSNSNLSLSPNPQGTSGRLSPNPGHHPSILPPATPNPTPASAAVDQKYVQAEGVVLTTKIWGQDDKAKVSGNADEREKRSSVAEEKGDQVQAKEVGNQNLEGFNLIWSKKEKVWVAVYSMVFDVAFLRLPFASPLLCLTLSATLRDKPLSLTSSSPVVAYITSRGLGGLSAPSSPVSPSSPQGIKQEAQPSQAEADILTGPPELNLLVGLFAGPTFAPPSSVGYARPPASSSTLSLASKSATTSPVTATNQSNLANFEGILNLPSTRLGPQTRATLFSLPPILPDSPTSSAMITPTPLPSAAPGAGGRGHVRQPTMGRGKAVLRKSFRKTLHTTSGLRVRMRTVFVPAMLLEEEDEGYGGSGEEDLVDVDIDEGKTGASGGQDGGGDDDDEADSDEEDEDEEDPDRLTSGASERTVVLCIEIENEGELSEYRNVVEPPGFLVEKVDILITGNAGGGVDGAKATLIGWNSSDADVFAAASAFRHSKMRGGRKKSHEGGTGSFPLRLASHEQHNLLYAVTFLRSPAEEALDGVGSLLNPPNLSTGMGVNSLPSAGVGMSGSLQNPSADKALQRAVTINIFGKPYFTASESRLITSSEAEEISLNYPTTTFSSRWNCILDLSLSHSHHYLSNYDEEYGEHTPGPHTGNISRNNNVLPEPPSPFPVSVSFSDSSFPSLPPSSSYPSFASVISPRDRRSLGLDLGLGSGSSAGSSPGRRFSLGVGFPSVSGAATAGMAVEKRHTLPNLPGISGVPARVRSAGAGFPGPNGGPGGITQRPASALGGVRDRRDSLGALSARERRDSLPASSSAAASTAGTKYTPPSVSLTAAVQQANSRSPTTYGAPPPPPFKDYPYSAAIGGGGSARPGVGLSVAIPSIDQTMGLITGADGGGGAGLPIPPMTPAYPAYPNPTNVSNPTGVGGLPPTPPSQGPIIPHGGNLPPNSANGVGARYIGPSVEVRRERGMAGLHDASGMMSAPVPQTPGPVISLTGQGGAEGTFPENFDREGNGEGDTRGGQSIVVSVGLLPRTSTSTSTSSSSPTSPHHHHHHKLNPPDHELIYPLSTFTLDIFVFNRSGWTRRFEVSCPDERTRRKRREIASYQNQINRQNPRSHSLDWAKVPASPGVLPLENRVRIGPLLPSACQSVRMKFLAVRPGVHSIDTLTLTDIESGFSMNLRSVMDVVVHEPQA